MKKDIFQIIWIIIALLFLVELLGIKRELNFIGNEIRRNAYTPTSNYRNVGSFFMEKDYEKFKAGEFDERYELGVL